MNTLKKSSGITLVEILIAVAILGTVAAMGTVAIRVVNSFWEQNSSLEVYRDTEVNLYQIARDVRNANSIIIVEPRLLKLSMFDFSRGFDSNGGIFDGVNIGTVTYQFVEDAGESYLRRTKEFNGEITEDKELLKNTLQPKDPETGVENPIFSQTSIEGDVVEIVFQVGLGLNKTKPRTYRVQSMIRSMA